MKLLIIGATPYFADRGCHIRIYEEAKSLIEAGVELELVTYHIGDDTEGIKTHRIPNIPWYKKTTVGSSGKGIFDWKIVADILLVFKTAVRIRKYKPDYIYGHNQEGFMIGLAAKILSLSRKPVILDAQGSLTHELITYGSIKKGSLQYKVFSMLESIAYKFASKIFVSSENMYEFMSKEYTRYIGKTSVLKDSYNSGVVEARLLEKSELRSKYEIPKEKNVLIYTGSFTESKGFDKFFSAIPQILEENPDYVVILAGASRIDYFKELLKEFNIEDRVRIISPLRYLDLGEVIRLGDVGIDPKIGTTEASGKLLNYMAGGLSCIGFDCTYNRSLLKERGNYFEKVEELPQILKSISIKEHSYDVIRDDSWKKSIQVILNLQKA